MAAFRGSGHGPSTPELCAAGEKAGGFLGEMGNDCSLSSCLVSCLNTKGLGCAGDPGSPEKPDGAQGSDCGCISSQRCFFSGKTLVYLVRAQPSRGPATARSQHHRMCSSAHSCGCCGHLAALPLPSQRHCSLPARVLPSGRVQGV